MFCEVSPPRNSPSIYSLLKIIIMSYELQKQKIYEIICNGNHSVESIYKQAVSGGISDDDVMAAFVGLASEVRIEVIDGGYYSTTPIRDSRNRHHYLFVIYTRGHELNWREHLCDNTNDATQHLYGMIFVTSAFRKRVGGSLYVECEDGTFKHVKSCGICPNILPRIL